MTGEERPSSPAGGGAKGDQGSLPDPHKLGLLGWSSRQDKPCITENYSCDFAKRGLPVQACGMAHYDFAQNFRALYDKAVDLYAKGQRDAETYFGVDETTFLAANGITAQHIYDYAEDHNNYGDPGFEIALTIEMVRRDYFLNVQNGQPSGIIADSATWPAKTDTIKGIQWLPRILPKVRAKLRGELPASVMYPCGGDRGFFKTYDIHPAEFLTLAWRNLDNDAATIDWVVNRSGK